MSSIEGEEDPIAEEVSLDINPMASREKYKI